MAGEEAPAPEEVKPQATAAGADESDEPIFDFKALTRWLPSGKAVKRKLYVIAGVGILATVFSFPFMQGIVSAMADKFIPEGIGHLVALGPLDVMMLQLFLSIIFGVLAAAPVVVYYLYRWARHRLSFLGRFVNRRALLVWGTIGAVVFLVGVYYAYNYLLPPMFKFLLQIGTDASITNNWKVADFVWFALMTLVLLAMAFEAPLVVFALVRSGILPLTMVLKGRRYLYLGIIIFSALFTSPDVITQLVTALPVIVFVELSILILKVVGPKEVKVDAPAANG